MSFDRSAPETPPSRPYSVLAVCTGNICRSPAVERLLAHALWAGADGAGAEADDGAGVSVTSAGVRAVVGASMPAPMAALVRGAGASTDGFVARQLTEEMLRGADLVLALTKWHRSRVVALYPGAVRRTFTLRELARLAGAVDRRLLPAHGVAERLAALLPLAAAQRGVRSVAAGADDVVDPYGGDEALYRQAFAELSPALAEIARAALPDA